MDVIVNDFSLNSQFNSIDDFVDSLLYNTIPSLSLLKSNSDLLLKSNTTYALKITSSETLYSFLSLQKFRGYPEAQKLRFLLGELMDDPFWNNSPKTDTESEYSTLWTGDFFGDAPNCFSEVLEREGILLSFAHSDFKVPEIVIRKNKTQEKLLNSFSKRSMADALFLKKCIGMSELLLYSSNIKNIAFLQNNGIYYADEYYDSGKLTQNDVLQIRDDFMMLIDGMRNNDVPRRLTDSITHKKINYYEFRTTISNSREFRIFYYLEKDSVIFLNSLIKTTQATPIHTKEKSCSLIKQYIL